MEESDRDKNFIEQLRDAGMEYFEARLQLTKVQAYDKIAKVTSVIFSLFIIALLGCFTILFLGMMIGFLIADLLDSNAIGFTVVGVFFSLMLIVLIVKRETILEKPIGEKIIKELFEEERKLHQETDRDSETSDTRQQEPTP